MNTKVNIEKSFMNCLVIICYIMILFSVLGFPSITSFLFYLSFLMLMITWLVDMMRGGNVLNRTLIIIMILSLINVVLEGIINNGHFGIVFFKKLLLFWSTLIAFYLSTRIKTDASLKKIFLYGAVTISFILIVLYYMNPALYYINGRGDSINYLTFNLDNPNKAGLFLTVFFIADIIFFVETNGKIKKLFSVIMSILIFHFIILTGSRNAFLCAVIFVILFVFYKFNKRKRSIPKYMYFVFSVIPLIFVFLYLLLIESEWINSIFSFLVVSDDKSLMTRSTIWQEAFFFINQSPILGAYSLASNGSGSFQLHNTHLDTWVSYGLIVLVLVVYYLYKIMIYNKNKQNLTVSQIVYTIGFFSIIFLGCGEAALFSGGTGINILCSILLLLANQTEEYR